MGTSNNEEKMLVSYDEAGNLIYTNASGFQVTVSRLENGDYQVSDSKGNTEVIPRAEALANVPPNSIEAGGETVNLLESNEFANNVLSRYLPEADSGSPITVQPNNSPKPVMGSAAGGSEATLDSVPQVEDFDNMLGEEYANMKGLEVIDEAGNKVKVFKKDAGDGEFYYYAVREDGQMYMYSPEYETYEESDFGQYVSRAHTPTPSDSEPLETEKYKFYINNKKKMDVEVSSDGNTYIVDGVKYTKEQFAEEFKDYYVKEAYYNPETGDFQTFRRYPDGTYVEDVNAPKNQERIDGNTFSQRYGTYSSLNTNGSTIFVDKEGHLHQIEFNGNTIIDSTDPLNKIEYANMTNIEDIARDNNWSIYDEAHAFEQGFNTTAGLFFCGEMKYITGAEYYATISSLYEYFEPNTFVVLNVLYIDADINRLKSLSSVDSELTSDILYLCDMDSKDLEINDSIFENFLTQLQKFNETVTEGYDNIKIIKNNLMNVDSEFSEEFKKEYNYLLRQYIRGITMGADGKPDKSKQFYSNPMLTMLQDAIDSGQFYGSDLEVLRAIKSNTDFEINASDWDKFKQGLGTLCLSIVEGIMSPLESVGDGALILVSMGMRIFGANDASNALLQMASLDFLEGLYDLATDGWCYAIAQGELHTTGVAIGDVVGDIIAWNTFGPLFNALKLAGELGDGALHVEGFDYDNDSDVWNAYLQAVKGFGFGWASKNMFKKAQEWLADPQQLARMGLTQDSSLWEVMLKLHSAQGLANMGIQEASNAADIMINYLMYGTNDTGLFDNSVQAFLNGFFASNKNVDFSSEEAYTAFINYIKDPVSRSQKILHGYSKESDDEAVDFFDNVLTYAKKWGLDAGKAH